MRQLRPILKGSTSPATYIRIWNPATNLPVTTVIPGTPAAVGLQLSYCRAGSAVVNFTAVAIPLPTPYVSGGLIHLFAGNYRLYLPTAATASAVGVDDVIVGGVLPGMVIVGAYHELKDAASTVTSIPTRLTFHLE